MGDMNDGMGLKEMLGMVLIGGGMALAFILILANAVR